jgi:hypothetical protein
MVFFIYKIDLLLEWTVFLFIFDAYTREHNQKILLIVLKQFSSGHGCTRFAIIQRRGIIDWAW